MMEELEVYLPKRPAIHVSYEVGEDGVDFPVVIPKNTYDAFLTPLPPHYPVIAENRQLESVLRKAEIERVVVCGVMTDCCVTTTARGCFNRGFETWTVVSSSLSQCWVI